MSISILYKIGLLYIDPGSGSYLVQMIIAAILGGLFYFKNLWRKFRAFFTKGKKEQEEKEQMEKGDLPDTPKNDHENA